MTKSRLIIQSLWHYRWTSGAVLLATAAAAAVLVGALVVGDSVRGTLRDRAMARLGGVQVAVSSPQRFFTAAIADRMNAAGDLHCRSWLGTRGSASAREGQARANSVEVIGIDEESWQQCGGRPDQFTQGAIINAALARQLGVAAGDRIVLRIARRTAMGVDAPLSETGTNIAALALDVAAVAPEAPWGNFSLRANQIPPFNVFVSRELLGRQLDRAGRANLILVSAPQKISAQQVQIALDKAYSHEDAGLRIVPVPGGKEMELRSEAVFLSPPEVRAATAGAPSPAGVLTYFVNELRVGDKATPYSMVTGIGILPLPGQENGDGPKRDSLHFPSFYKDLRDDQIVINAWLADDLAAKGGDTLTLKYYVMGDTDRLSETSRAFTIVAVTPMEGLAADASLMPDFPGLAGAANCRDWKGGPYINLSRIRPKDEQYWKQYRGTPKAFVTLAAAQSMWANRYGNLTAVRFIPSGMGVSPMHPDTSQDHGRDARGTQKLHPQDLGIVAQDVREQALAAAEGANDFAGLFIGLSFFIIASALLLTALVFSLGITQRSEQIGILKATGFTAGGIRRMLMAEGGILALGGAPLGVLLGIGYAWLILRGLSTIWSGAVAEAQISLHASPVSLISGAALAAAAAIVSMYVTLRRLTTRSCHDLLAGLHPSEQLRSRYSQIIMIVVYVAAAATYFALSFLVGPETPSYHNPAAELGFGTFVLLSFIWMIVVVWSNKPPKRSKLPSIRRLVGRYLLRRRGRNVAAIVLLACAIFLITTISVFHQGPSGREGRSASGTGGFEFLGRTAVAVPADKASLPSEAVAPWPASFSSPRVIPLRLHEGDDASCLNLNAARQPRILGVDASSLRGEGISRFSFVEVLKDATSSGWKMLDNNHSDSVPAIADQNTITYALHSAVGKTIAVTGDTGEPVKLLLVGAIRNSILQGSIIISEKQFVRHFQSEGGYRMFLICAWPEENQKYASTLTEEYQDYGLELRPAEELLSQLNSVQNTYLAIFQALGGLGLVLGSVGLGLVLMRNVLERRAELAILRAVGFARRRIVAMVLTEHLALLAMGLVIGLAAAAAVVIPQARFMGTHVPVALLAAVLGGVIVIGVGSAVVAARLALRGQLIDALREE